MLSCRYSGPGTAQYNRRLASADRVLGILQSQPDGHEGPPPLPLVPYAMSISTCVIYRALRDEARDADAAYADLRRCCEALDALGQCWTSTRGVAKLAKKLWSIRRLDEAAVIETTPEEQQHVRKRPRVEPDIPTAVHHSVYPTPGLDGGGTISTPVPTPFPGQSGGQMQDISYVLEPWGELDMAFHDLFDYSLPNAFRNPATWEYFESA